MDVFLRNLAVCLLSFPLYVKVAHVYLFVCLCCFMLFCGYWYFVFNMWV
jgi:hypothetical protein